MLEKAVRSGKIEVLQFLLQHTTKMWTDAAFLRACSEGHFTAVKELLPYLGLLESVSQRKTRLGISMDDSTTKFKILILSIALKLTVYHGDHVKIVKFLIKHGADCKMSFVKFKSKRFVPKLVLSCERVFLEDASVVKKTCGYDSSTIFEVACLKNRVKVVRFLLSHYNNKPDISKSTLCRLCFRNYREIVLMLFRAHRFSSHVMSDCLLNAGYKLIRPLLIFNARLGKIGEGKVKTGLHDESGTLFAFYLSIAAQARDGRIPNALRNFSKREKQILRVLLMCLCRQMLLVSPRIKSIFLSYLTVHRMFVNEFLVASDCDTMKYQWITHPHTGLVLYDVATFNAASNEHEKKSWSWFLESFEAHVKKRKKDT